MEEGDRMTTLTLNGEQYRIRRLDPRNLVIERLTEPTEKTPAGRWDIQGYYGKLDDLAQGILNLAVRIPEAPDLASQVVLLRQELKTVERHIVRQLEGQEKAMSGQLEQAERVQG